MSKSRLRPKELKRDFQAIAELASEMQFTTARGQEFERQVCEALSEIHIRLRSLDDAIYKHQWGS